MSIRASHEQWLDITHDPAGDRAAECDACNGVGSFVDTDQHPLPGRPDYVALDLWEPAEQACDRCDGRGWL